MLSGKHHVAEVGCGDAFGSRIVASEVSQLTVSDFDPVFIDAIEQSNNTKWHAEAQFTISPKAAHPALIVPKAVTVYLMPFIAWMCLSTLPLKKNTTLCAISSNPRMTMAWLSSAFPR